MPQIEKSSRHQNIIGRFGEYVVLNWLSRSGFEVEVVDHTGIDLVAFNPKTKDRLGITVKSRTRDITSKDSGAINLFYSKKNDRRKLKNACDTFGSEAWIAVYVETLHSADLYLTSLENYDSKYRGIEGRVLDTWGMSAKHKDLYEADTEVKHMHADFREFNWFPSTAVMV
jgi:hypothetical protein